MRSYTVIGQPRLAKRLKDTDGHSVSLICGSRVGNDTQMDAKAPSLELCELVRACYREQKVVLPLSECAHVPSCTHIGCKYYIEKMLHRLYITLSKKGKKHLQRLASLQ